MSVKRLDTLQNSQISFTSGIKPVTWAEFYKQVDSLPLAKNVKDWTANGIEKAQNVYTAGIKDCSAFGITDENGVALSHICPTYRVNDDFTIVEKVLDEKINTKYPHLQGFLFGADSFFEKSKQVYKNFKKYSSQRKIPFSSIGRCKKGDSTSAAAYIADQKTWLITNDYISNYIERKKPKNVNSLKKFLETIFEEVMISKQDKLLV